MPLASLASVSDLEDRGVTVSAEEQTVVATALDTASALIRDVAGSPISEVTDTVTIEGSASSWLALPGRPVSAVSEVLVDGSSVTDYTLSAGSLWRACGWRSFAVTVTYTHGLPTVPADVVDIVCRLAVKSLVSFREQPDGTGVANKPLISERIGDYSAVYTYAPTFSEMDIPKDMRARLAARFGNGGARMVNLR